MDRRLIEHFVNANLLSRQDMQRVILRASKAKTGLVSQILDMGVIDEDSLAKHIASFYHYEPLDNSSFFMDDSVLGMLDQETATQQGALPFGYEPGSARVYVAVYEPDRCKEALAKVEATSGQAPVVRIATKSWLDKAIPFYYGSDRGGAQLPSGASQNNSRVQNSWTQRPRSSGRIPPIASQSPNREGDFGSDMPMVSGMHRISSRVSQSPRTATPRTTPRPIQSRSMTEPNDDFDEFEALLRDEGPDLSPRASVIGRPRISRRNDESSFGDFSGQNSMWDQVSRHPALNSPPPSSGWNHQEPQPHAEPSGSFSLFDEPSEVQSRNELTLQDVVEKQHQQINKLKSEAQRQREVIQALADLLIEARVISRRDLTRKLQSLRSK